MEICFSKDPWICRFNLTVFRFWSGIYTYFVCDCVVNDDALKCMFTIEMERKPVLGPMRKQQSKQAIFLYTM